MNKNEDGGDCAGNNDKSCVFFVFTENPDTGLGICGWILVYVSFFLVIITFPLSIWMCIKVNNISSTSGKVSTPNYINPLCVYMCVREIETILACNSFSFISLLENSLWSPIIIES